MNEENFETYFLIWLDNSNKSSDEKFSTQNDLHGQINCFKMFSDEFQCQNYIESLSNDDKIIFIVHIQTGKHFIPRIHHLQQLTAIFVLCNDTNKHQLWANEYKKIKCLVSENKELVAQIVNDQKRRHRAKIDESLSMSIFNESFSNTSDLDSLTIDNQFLYSYLLCNSLIKMTPFYTDRNEFIKLCGIIYNKNQNELLIVNEFRRGYSLGKCIYWLTKHSFISKLINKSIRMKNFQILFLMRFLFQDIYQEVEKRKCFKSINVYRTQILSNKQIDLLKNSIGKVLCMNSFLITNLNRKQSISYLKDSIVLNENYRSVLFEITADPNLDSIQPFANITSLSAINGEQQVLFMLGSLFQIKQIIDEDNNSLIIIQLTLTSYQDHELHSLKLTNDFDFLSFGQMLIDKKYFNQAQIYFHHFIHQISDENSDRSICYDSIGYIYFEKRNFNSSLKWYRKGLDIKLNLFESNDTRIASSYNSIAMIYLNKNDYQLALESYQMAMKIYKEKFTDDHIQIADCLNNMSIVYKAQRKYTEALELYNKALVIQQNHLSDNHPDIAMSFYNIGLIHGYLSQYDQALINFNRSLKIYENILPYRHALISMISENIANIHYDRGDLKKALVFYEKASKNYRQQFLSSHPDVLQVEMIIKRIKIKIKK